MPQIIPPEVRLAEPHGARVGLFGPNGVGKTSQIRTLDPSSVLIVDSENGLYPVNDLPFDVIRVETWSDIQDVIVRIAGPIVLSPHTSLTLQHIMIALAAPYRTSIDIRPSFSKR